MDIVWRAGNQVGAFLDSASKEFYGITEEAAVEIGERVLETSNKKVPTETGDLKASGKVIKGRTSKSNQILIKVRYGTTQKDNADYASIVHYDPNLTHDDGEDRFLQKAMDEHKLDIVNLISDKFRSKARKVPKPTS